jgi:hypothetical protein
MNYVQIYNSISLGKFFKKTKIEQDWTNLKKNAQKLIFLKRDDNIWGLK